MLCVAAFNKYCTVKIAGKKPKNPKRTAEAPSNLFFFFFSLRETNMLN